MSAIDLDLHLALAAVSGRRLPKGVSPGLREEALAQIAADGLARPRFVWRSHLVEGTRGATFDLAAGSLELPGLAGGAAGIVAVGAVVCTLGESLESRVSELCAGRRLSLAFALDQVGNELLFHAARKAVAQVRKMARARGCRVTEPLTPGGTGVGLDQQETVVALAGGGEVGVVVTDSGVLHPVKSRSLVIGVGNGFAARRHSRRCERCSSRQSCMYRNR